MNGSTKSALIEYGTWVRTLQYYIAQRDYEAAQQIMREVKGCYHRTYPICYNDKDNLALHLLGKAQEAIENGWREVTNSGHYAAAQDLILKAITILESELGENFRQAQIVRNYVRDHLE